MKPLSAILWVLVPVSALAGVALLAVAFGGPKDPPPMPSINNPFKSVDFSGLPSVSHFVARDGASLAFREYLPADGAPRGSVVLVHGSSSQGRSMHVVARAFAGAGYIAFALDVRGHGESGARGRIDYVGQLEDDLEDFVRSVGMVQPATLVGFSAGGGFALRFAGSERQKLFSGYVLLSPFISQDAPTYRKNAGGWVSVGIPRVIALTLFNAAGIHAFNDLAVVKFALSEEVKSFLTPYYSFALALNFRPQRDYRANIRAVGQPLRVVAGEADEVHYADRFAGVFKAEGKDVPVTLVPGIGHIPLTLDPAAVQAAVAAVKSLN